ncbi:MAG: monovalent cation/H+ antiporter complex subunit F [Pseudomonadota bacterium]|nr:monovalent cation/H+ antiporter complex subunit F [Pseudomonadota bacterium]MED5274832.1 monovalent cation/H+ antiporter complex subunit F [Pseudomonadota bacterium]|tara:strand:+ start:1150 stop:1416 length:267 start_codon:yes stop_codon:yes gene_type:complete
MIEIYTITIVVIALAILMSIIRFISLEDIFTKILTTNLLGTKIVLLILLISSLSNQVDFSDIAMVYALINFISTIVILKYFENRGISK